jgi:sialate O-acetylesterase
MKRVPSRLLTALAALLVGAGPAAAADLVPAGLFTDSVVLQRDTAVPVWGRARPGEAVTVEFAGQRRTAPADARGQWVVRLDPMPANATPRDLAIRTASETSVLRDVVVGDVWLCSGQSNMAFRMAETADAGAEIAAAANPAVRFFRVAERFAREPGSDVRGEWRRVSPESAADCSAVAWYFAQAVQRELGVPVGLLVSSVGGTRIETWMAPETLRALGAAGPLLEKWNALPPAEFERILTDYRAYQHQLHRMHPEAVRAAKVRGEPAPPEPGRPALRGHDCPGALHHGMIAPLQPFALRGVLWYQGEANVGAPGAYPGLQGALVADWRRVWGADLPFLFVQLAPHRTATPAFREAQFRAWRETPRSAMVVTTDVGDAQNIHPTRKRPVGERLAAAALALAHGRAVESSGPVFRSLRLEPDRAVLAFDHAADGLRAAGGALTGFTVAGADGNFAPVRAEIDGSTVVIPTTGLTPPIAVRFGWANVPEVNLFNAAGFPAVPFRTDRPETADAAPASP